MNPALPQFTHPAILQAIGHIRVPMFLAGFADDLKAANILLPTAPDSADFRVPNPAPDSPHGLYFAAVAALLPSPALLPERLRAAVFTRETAAAPQNQDWLEATVQRRIPGV